MSTEKKNFDVFSDKPNTYDPREVNAIDGLLWPVEIPPPDDFRGQKIKKPKPEKDKK